MGGGRWERGGQEAGVIKGPEVRVGKGREQRVKVQKLGEKRTGGGSTRYSEQVFLTPCPPSLLSPSPIWV